MKTNSCVDSTVLTFGWLYDILWLNYLTGGISLESALYINDMGVIFHYYKIVNMVVDYCS